MKAIKLFGFPVLLFGLFLMSIFPFQSCERDDDHNDNRRCDTCNICDTCLVVYKPNIYIYPEEKSQLIINLIFPLGGKIVKSIPEYGSGWNIDVDTNGLINNKYTYLFYESKQPDIWQENEGWIIKRSDLNRFFNENMISYGFRGREIQDFTDYWIPRLTSYELYVIYPQEARIINNAIQLKFSREPDQLLRLFYVVKGLKKYSDKKLQEPQIGKLFDRKGFFVTEWGVILK
jgi:hypothetical protein